MPVDDVTLHKMAQRLRRDCLESTAEAGSGHPTSCMSAAENSRGTHVAFTSALVAASHSWPSV